MRESRRQACLAAGVLLVLAIVHHQVLFLGRSLVHTNHSNVLMSGSLNQNLGFHYWPPGLTIGLFISGTSVVLLCGLGAMAVKRR